MRIQVAYHCASCGLTPPAMLSQQLRWNVELLTRASRNCKTFWINPANTNFLLSFSVNLQRELPLKCDFMNYPNGSPETFLFEGNNKY